MGLFTKPESLDTALVLPFILNQPVPLIWTVADLTDGIETITVQGYTDDELEDAYAEFKSAEKTPKVLRFAEEYDVKTFTHLDYTRGLDIRLAPQRTFDKGVLTHVDYYAVGTPNAQTGAEEFTDKVVCEQYDYVRNAEGFALYRTLTIKWITEAETEHTSVKTRVKNYDFTDSVRETDRRRKNVLDQLKTAMIGIFTQGMGMTVSQAVNSGQEFFESHLDHILAFTDIGEVQGLLDSISADTAYPWLDVVISAPTTTMRMYILSKLSEAIMVGL